MFVAGEDLGDDDAFELAAEFLHAFDFEAEHGQPLRKFFGRPVEIDVLFEPVKSDFHVRMLKSDLARIVFKSRCVIKSLNVPRIRESSAASLRSWLYFLIAVSMAAFFCPGTRMLHSFRH